MNTYYEVLSLPLYPIQILKFVNHSSGNHIHWHEEIEILYFVEGEGEVSCNLHTKKIKKGDIVLFNGKELHTGCIKGNDTVYYCIHINTDFFHNLIGNEYVLFDNIIVDDKCQSLIIDIINEGDKNGYKNIVSIKKKLYDLFQLLSENYVNSVFTEDDYKKQFKRLDTYNSIIEFIDKHYNEDLCISDLAARFFISPSYFSHFFKKKTDKSVTEYINEVRINHAKSFLEMEDITIGDIACKVGFNDINYFSRKFKMITGMTPKEYKRKKL